MPVLADGHRNPIVEGDMAMRIYSKSLVITGSLHVSDFLTASAPLAVPETSKVQEQLRKTNAAFQSGSINGPEVTYMALVNNVVPSSPPLAMVRSITAPPPALSPAIVTCFGSPPNCAMWLWVHSREECISCKPAFGTPP